MERRDFQVVPEFDFLLEFVALPGGCDQRPRGPANRFERVGLDELRSAETTLGRDLPVPLRRFYLEIGAGSLRVSSDATAVRDHPNRFLYPEEIAGLLSGEHEWAPEEGFDDGELPFFEVGDKLFLVMRPGSSQPNAVFWPFGGLVEVEFARFVRRMYFEHPRYFVDAADQLRNR